MTWYSCLYVGSVMHRRLRPRPYALRHRVFWMLLDLDEVDQLGRTLRLFSHGRFNAFSFHDRDHGDGSLVPLRAQAERHLSAAGIEPDGGAIRLLCMPRILGYGFNPLSIFFCYGRDGVLRAILYEVHNTFAERHTYVVPVEGTHQHLLHQADKAFYVSPFLGPDMTYRFGVSPPAQRVAITIRTDAEDGPMLFAALQGTRTALSDRRLLRLLFSHPLLTLSVIFAIHWHALRLWRRGLPVHVHSAPSGPAATIAKPEQA